jgi:hypothetical protein
VPHLDRWRAANASACANGLRHRHSQASDECARRLRQRCPGQRARLRACASEAVELLVTERTVE